MNYNIIKLAISPGSGDIVTFSVISSWQFSRGGGGGGTLLPLVLETKILQIVHDPQG